MIEPNLRIRHSRRQGRCASLALASAALLAAVGCEAPAATAIAAGTQAREVRGTGATDPMAAMTTAGPARDIQTGVVPLRAYPAAPPPDPQAEIDAQRVPTLDAQRADRITGGVDSAMLQAIARLGYARWLEEQLHPHAATLPAAVTERIAQLDISRLPLTERVQDENAARMSARQLPNDDGKLAALKSYQQSLTRQALQADQRWLLQAVNSPNQVQERMVWFWLNHFSVGQKKSNLRAFVGDYEESMRPHALGKFRELLEASAFNPAMLRFLDNERNAAGRINENYAREIMELHTLGLDGGYSQKDVQELARVLTGLGVHAQPGEARPRPAQGAGVVRDGLFEFNPARHDHDDKTLLGAPVKAGGLDEVRAVLDRLARSPATARHVSTKIAQYFVSDDPPPALVDRMTRRFLDSDGDIAAVLKLLFTSPEFDASLGRRFKDPWQYVVSATRLVYDGSTIVNAQPMINALNRLGEMPFGRQTPDGWPMVEAAWASPGQLTTRFDVARALVGPGGNGNPNFFRDEGDAARPIVPRPHVQSVAWQRTQAPRVSAATREALADTAANAPGDWAWAAIASPEFMRN